ncbi:MAG: riboflavin synthase [Acidobacteria bacterium]|nr:riboflavin synthase [Acidobacteriota bacterium]
MFTGIIEEIGTIQGIRFVHEGAAITISAGKILRGLKIGDSVAVNGVCLTATSVEAGAFACDISAETLRLSSFKQAKQGYRVNLERSLQLGGRLGGHIVLGHVDGVGSLLAKIPSGEGFEISFSFPKELERYLVYKGSIAVNGVSLTIASLEKGSFSVAAIPLTLEETNLVQLNIGDPVNLEVDILGKYFERFFQLGISKNEKADSRISAEYLQSQGF